MNSEFVPFIEYKDEKRTAIPRVIIRKYLYHWPMFIASAVLFTTLAYVYLSLVDPVYNVQAKLLFKDLENSSSKQTNLQELNFIPNNKLVDNEIEVLTSKGLMQKVVNDLKLWIEYYREGKLSNRQIYNDSPLRLTLVESYKTIIPTDFRITVKDMNHLMFRQGKKEIKLNRTSLLENRYGKWKLEMVSSPKDYLGATFLIRIKAPELATQEFLSRLYVAPINKQATVVALNLKETLPARGKDVLDRLLAVYDSSAVQEKTRFVKNTLTFIDDRLASVASELENAEKIVAGYKSSKGLTEIGAQSEFFLDNFQANDAKLSEVEVQLEVLKGIERYVNDPSSVTAPATVGISDPGLIKLTDQLIDLELQKDRMSSSIPENHPLFASLNQQINSTRQSIKNNVQGVKGSLVATLSRLKTYNNRVESSIKELPGQEREYIDVKRQQAIKEELYTYLLKKREEAALSYGSTLPDSRALDKAFYGAPISPKKPLTYLITLFFSLALPAGIITLRDVFNNRVVSSAEIQEATLVPQLGELMFQHSFIPIVMNDIKNRVIAEQFRMLRTNLQDLPVNSGKGRVIQITSGMPGEGKSFITSNLGISFASAGHKTIIVELDMRRPAICKNFKLNPADGLSDYLQGHASIDNIIQTVDLFSNLFVIGSGQLPSNPLELLSQPYLEKLIDFLRSNFDEILIDTPPIRLLAEGRIVSRFSDLNLYVIRQDYTPKEQLKYIEELYKSNKMKNLHLVLNGVRCSSRYSYSQDNDYGYYLDREEQKKTTLASGFKNVIERF